ncbi:deoxyribodipyrimidine photo-lyase [Aliidiomarina sedimenti]|uniref:Deoxyribodipyrimidine photo-lyase n=1 Tax=Aliidiomarina sedimenti TaxID=1933879 RepID=A0ABY0C1I2_9GAMM|nr:FAD-binding domain-containing protein [Aliidiomarina sedimenti]RUO31679.1 deoxyribodipyrimidine photo-lyase [Aliidiomarina sedimenti]
MTGLVWFRQDLRLDDNDALLQAMQNHRKVVAVVALTEAQWSDHEWAPIKRDLYQRQLNFLGEALAELGIELRVVQCDYYRELPRLLLQLANEVQVSALYANRDYALDERRRDAAVDAWFEQHDLQCHWFDSNLLVRPLEVKPQTSGYYKKFTPFFKSWCARLAELGIAESSKRTLAGYKGKAEALNFTPIDLDAAKRDASQWARTERDAGVQLQGFIEEQVADYQRKRDVPADDATSRLSPLWEVGVLSPRAAARALQALSPEFPYGLDEGAKTWLSELAWREFYQHLMFHVPALSMGKAFQAYTEEFPWRYDKADFARWCEGRTGYPIVDAGMRQLQAEGWMHNRVRMIVANFLVKDLHIDWRWGERFFMQHLVDGSFAANNGGWQWSASTGTDAVPYFRVFNPTRQSEQVDPQGLYIRKWVSELNNVPAKYIHTPHDYLRAKGSTDYPQPMVDHKAARETFISTFKGLKTAVNK